MYSGYSSKSAGVPFCLMALGVEKIPSIISEAEAPTEVVGNVLDLQSFGKLCSMPRPTLLKDFLSKAA